jgi:NDP-sugar pyrophosphorylase family protein
MYSINQENIDLSQVTAIILAGGLGVRLRTMVPNQPKVLAKVQNRPFIEYLLEQLATAQIKNVVLCIGYLGEQIQEHFGKNYGGMNILYSQELSPLGTAGALRLALPYCQSETVLAMNGDSYCDVKLTDFWNWYCQKRINRALLLTAMPDTQRYGQVQIDADGQILKFQEKAQSQGRGWINAGIYLFKQELLQSLPTQQTISLEQEVFPQWAGQGLYGYCHQGRFLDIGTPESYIQAEQFFTAHFFKGQK